MAGIAERSAMCCGKQVSIKLLCAFGLLMLLPGCSSPPLEGCGGSVIDFGTIATPNFPHTYPANIRCIWNLVAKNGNVIVIQFVDVAIDLTRDMLLIYNGSTLFMNVTGSPPPFNLTLGPRVTLEFKSDESVGNLGFQLRWMTGISCQPGFEYFDGHTCMPCTGASNYLSRKVRNCSRDKDAEYAEAYSLPVQRDIANDTVLSSTVIPKEDHTENAARVNLLEWLGPVIAVIVIFIVIVVLIAVTCVYKMRCKNSNESSSRPPYSPVPTQVVT